MVTTPDAYREYLYQDFPLPSGHVFQIKPQITMWDFFTEDDLVIPNSQASKPQTPATPEQLARWKRIAERGLVNCVIQPRLTAGYDADGVPICVLGMLHVAELELASADYKFLLRTCMDKAGLSEEAAREVESFRTDKIGDIHTPVGGEGAPLAVGHSAAEPTGPLSGFAGDGSPPDSDTPADSATP